jgi:hypothetical protein
MFKKKAPTAGASASSISHIHPNYVFFIHVLGNTYTVQIPIAAIAEEKLANWVHIFSTDLELLNGFASTGQIH